MKTIRCNSSEGLMICGYGDIYDVYIFNHLHLPQVNYYSGTRTVDIPGYGPIGGQVSEKVFWDFDGLIMDDYGSLVFKGN